jgi:hypothetical protein
MRKDTMTQELFPTASALTPSMDYRDVVSGLVSQALASFEGDRYLASAEISRLVATRSVSKCMLDGYTSPSRDEFNVPFYLIPAIEAATHTRLLSAWLVRCGGGQAVFGQDVTDVEIGRVERQRDELNRRIAALKKTRGLK